ncbi:MAG: hypothetical protein K1X88_23620, partial [Nannocystaceae bacterium]|nr:hypothetical protein [Nannocystaceae bacterium]
MLAAVLALGLAPAPVELDWRAPQGCPDREAARASLDRLLAEAGTPEGTPVRATIVVDPQRGGYRAIVQLGEQDAGRELWSPSCGELADAALLIVAMAIDPRLGGGPELPPSEPQVGPEVPEPTATPTPASSPRVTASREPEVAPPPVIAAPA